MRRAGGKPICADLFADFDLRDSAEVIPVRRYPNSLPDDVANVKADGWFYCGALENHPEIIERILSLGNRIGPLLGTPPDPLRLVRDADWLASVLHSADLPALDVKKASSPPRSDGSWLQKPIASAGGRLIRVWDQAASQVPLLEPHYFQRRVSGIGLSALFRVKADHIIWLGSTRELETVFASQSPTLFSYCGSVGPLNRIPIARQRSISAREPHCLDPLTRGANPNHTAHENDLQSLVDHSTLQKKLTAIAQAVVNGAPGLRGLIGFDFRFDGDNVWLTEVNPRYTASVEVLELSMTRSLLDPFDNAATDRAYRQLDSESTIVAKQILYAASSMVIPDLSDYLPGDDPWQIPLAADLPVPNSVVEPGWPICTVMAEGANLEIVESKLRDRVSAIRALLASSGTP